jgi:hypothetical protein
VLLTREAQFETWLSGSPEEALALAPEAPPERCASCRKAFKEDQLDIAA